MMLFDDNWFLWGDKINYPYLSFSPYMFSSGVEVQHRGAHNGENIF